MFVGVEEASALKLHRSTLRKVDILANIFGRTLDKNCVTQSSSWEARAISPQTIAEMMAEHWRWTVVAIISAIATVWGLLRTFGS
jgi:hypothetical protein